MLQRCEKSHITILCRYKQQVIGSATVCTCMNQDVLSCSTWFINFRCYLRFPILKVKSHTTQIHALELSAIPMIKCLEYDIIFSLKARKGYF